MSAKQAVTPALTARRQMDERAERAITDEHGVVRQIRMHQGDVRHVMRPQGSGQHFADIARPPLARQQQVRRGEATTCGLSAGLSKGFLQVRRVGHGKARAIDDVDLVAVPEFIGTQRIGVEALLRNGVLQPMQEAEGQAATRLAIGRGAELQTSQVRQVAARGVAVQNLLEKQECGYDGRERSSALAKLRLVGQALHEALGQVRFEIALDPLEGMVDSNHKDLLSKMSAVATTIMAGGPRF
jgi:hypothetical protein